MQTRWPPSLQGFVILFYLLENGLWFPFLPDSRMSRLLPPQDFLFSEHEQPDAIPLLLPPAGFTPHTDSVLGATPFPNAPTILW